MSCPEVDGGTLRSDATGTRETGNSVTPVVAGNIPRWEGVQIVTGTEARACPTRGERYGAIRYEEDSHDGRD
jgi:hypothetical protein